MGIRRLLTTLIALLLATSAQANDEFFETHVRPLLAKRCYECHQRQAEGGLRLDSRSKMLTGGSSGAAIVPGDPAGSLLIRAVHRQTEDLAMPPDEALSKEEVQILEQWIRTGAAWPNEPTASRPDAHGITSEERDFWSFRPISRPSPPAIDAPQELHPVDAFITAKHLEHGLTRTKPSPARKLIRRLSYDLIGLPPTPAEIDRFESHAHKDWHAAVGAEIDRLLASPQYGERWAQHWLDLVRYADTAGDAADFPIPEAYKYRNYVIDAFNADKPYDQFVREQIAGDLMSGEDADKDVDEDADEDESWQRTIATGYLALSRRVGVTPRTHIVIEDTLNNLGKTFLGLTIGCARCHDHKFDPIQAADYYALYGIFQSTNYPHAGSEHSPHRRHFVYRDTEDRVQEAMAAYQPKLDELRRRERATLERYRDLQRKPESELKYSRAEAWQWLLDVREEIREFAETMPDLETAFAASEGEPEDAYIHQQGDPRKRGEPVRRGFLQVLGGQTLANDVDASGRLQLANWIASAENPLTARVIANRVWHYHFGRGLVATTSDFGIRGEQPTHPELLDYLATYLIDNNWSIKSLHRLILSSTTWQLASDDIPENSQVDPDNLYLWRGNRQRLDAEQLRDTCLLMSGQLKDYDGGPHPFPHRHTYFFRQHEPFVGEFVSDQRSVYLFRQRIRKDRFLDLFDGPDGNLHLGKRRPTTTSLQSLYLLNSEFIAKQSAAIATRIVAEPDNEARVRWAYTHLFGRSPTDNEVKSVLKNIPNLQTQTDPRGSEAWSHLIHAMLCSNEFLYVD